MTILKVGEESTTTTPKTPRNTCRSVIISLACLQFARHIFIGILFERQTVSQSSHSPTGVQKSENAFIEAVVAFFTYRVGLPTTRLERYLGRDSRRVLSLSLPRELLTRFKFHGINIELPRITRCILGSTTSNRRRRWSAFFSCCLCMVPEEESARKCMPWRIYTHQILY